MRSFFRIRIVFLLLGLLPLLWSGQVMAQLSEGGIPRLPLMMKGASRNLEVMPQVNNDQLRWESVPEENSAQDEGKLKPLRFAHAFETSFSPATHGVWMNSGDGWRIWQLTIRSSGAYSLSLLFTSFQLPPRARLFLFTPGKEHLRGAYTSANNSSGGVFIFTPLPGEEIIVQYECLPEDTDISPFTISAVNHDFLGVFSHVDERRPMGVQAGDCNQDANCGVAGNWSDVRNSVCRIMIEGRELCTGSLINNSAENQIPYILTANHCISTPREAAGSLFLFNYESPYCGPLDGDVSNSLAGSLLRATLDSLDFSLVEMSTPPPPFFRPYYAGWNRDSRQNDTTATIHHPQGDIKKFTVDYETPKISSFLSQFSKSSFWKIDRWDVGTTELGSSGSPLFNRHSQITGLLSGGAASCSNPVNDYFARLDKAWDYKADSSRQLKCWLDPVNTNALSINGKQFNQDEELHQAYTNMEDGDNHQLVPVRGSNDSFEGYWSGTNNRGITEVAEQFILPKKAALHSVSLGIGKRRAYDFNSFITLKFYEFSGNEATLLSPEIEVKLNTLYRDAMNLIRLDQPLIISDTLLVAVNLENIAETDSIAIYQSNRTSGRNTLFLLKEGRWSSFQELFPESRSASLAIELVASHIDIPDITPAVAHESIRVYPNPAVSHITISGSETLHPEMVEFFNILGQPVPFQVIPGGDRRLDIRWEKASPGFYLIRIKTREGYSGHKILITNN